MYKKFVDVVLELHFHLVIFNNFTKQTDLTYHTRTDVPVSSATALPYWNTIHCSHSAPYNTSQCLPHLISRGLWSSWQYHTIPHICHISPAIRPALLKYTLPYHIIPQWFPHLPCHRNCHSKPCCLISRGLCSSGQQHTIKLCFPYI